MPLRKLDGLVWHSGLSNFPALGSSCPTGGRRKCSGHLLRSCLSGQNPQQVLTIPGGSASTVVPMVHTTPPNEDKVDTSSAEVPTAQALAARPGSKALDDNLTDNDLDLLNFDAAEYKIVCWMSSQL
jgi:hypothetical protein